jgi:hypothetical protein
MKETGILFKAEMVRARLAGLKTQTRRIIDPQPPFGCIYGINGAETHAICCAADNHAVWVPPTPKSKDHRLPCPYGGPGDLLWVKETHARVHPGMLQSLDPDPDSPLWETVYRADTHGGYVESLLRCTKWRPSIFMPRRFSRITLEIVSVRVERLQDISAQDCIAEGIQIPRCGCEVCATQSEICTADAGELIMAYKALWESIHGPGSWDLNPYVWVIEFKGVQP